MGTDGERRSQTAATVRVFVLFVCFVVLISVFIRG
jgi:hypothetical protein